VLYRSLALVALTLLALPSAAQEAPPSDGEVPDGPVTIRERVMLPSASSNSVLEADASLREGAGIAGYIELWLERKARSFGAPSDLQFELLVRRPGERARVVSSESVGPHLPISSVRRSYCQGSHHTLDHVERYYYEAPGERAQLLRVPISHRDALPDTEVTGRVITLRDTLSLGRLPLPTGLGSVSRSVPQPQQRCINNLVPDANLLCSCAQREDYMPVVSRYALRVRQRRTAPAPTFIAEPTVSPDSLRIGEASTIGLDVVSGDGSPLEFDDSAAISLFLSSTAHGELYEGGIARGGTLEGVSVSDLTDGHIQFIAHDELGPGGLTRVSVTADYNGDSSSGFVDVHVVPDRLLVTADPDSVGFGERARVRVEGRSFRDEPVALDVLTLVSLRLETGLFGSLEQEATGGLRQAVEVPVVKGDTPKGEAPSVERTLELADIALGSFETNPVWFVVRGESPPADTTLTVEATSEWHAGGGELTVRGGTLDHLALSFETPEGERTDTLRYGAQFAHVVVEGRTADDEPIWLDPNLVIQLELDPVVEPLEDAAAVLYDAIDGPLIRSFSRRISPPSLLAAGQSQMRVEALYHPVGEEPRPFTVTASVVDSASVGPAERTGYVVEDYYLNLVAEPARVRPGERAALRLEAISKRSLADTLALPEELAFDLSFEPGRGSVGGFEVGEAEPVVSISGVTAGAFLRGEMAYRAPATVRADTLLPDSLDAPLASAVVAVARSGDEELRGVARIDVLPARCSLDWTYYRQGDPDWGSDTYSNTDGTISGKGCAMTTIAMASTALGYEINPGALNDSMKVWGGYSGGSVLWEETATSLSTLFESDSLVASRLGGSLFVYNDSTETFVFDNSARWNPLDVLDDAIDECTPISVQVDNKNSGQHWVMVIGKDSEGNYEIFDPASNSREDLSYYSNKFWGYVKFKLHN
jgi:hypothetical protein